MSFFFFTKYTKYTIFDLAKTGEGGGGDFRLYKPKLNRSYKFMCTAPLTPWSTALLERFKVPQIFKKFPNFTAP